jgi:hypothetical protein
MHESEFEEMCQHIYEEVFFNRGARRNGRRGQLQNGTDILVHDFQTTTMDRRGGMVLVQSKYTESDKPDFRAAKAAALMARDKVNSDDAYRDVYLFIVATSAKNDAKLHDDLKRLKESEQLPFEIQLHPWDKLCSLVKSSDRLWYLYNTDSGEGVPVEYRLQVDLLTNRIVESLKSGLLNDANKAVEGWKYPGYRTSYGHDGLRAPADIWKWSPPLRKALIEVYSAAADSWNCVPLLECELNLNHSHEADRWLSYLLAQRVVGNLRKPSGRFPLVGDMPQFAPLLTTMCDTICKAQGSPDDLGCLALMLIMETSDTEIRDKALGMMLDLVTRAGKTQWDAEARIAHAVVRFFYVSRRGWTLRTQSYALGDSIDDGRWVGMSDALLGTPFSHDSTCSTYIAGVNPLALGGSGSVVLERLTRWIVSAGESEVLPNLVAQCRI